ncbi:MAG TPA: LUD domain-containing protein [Myxococcales bacterium]|nr:LUD domain-containing protein [Myxococcales bacterium]
MSARDEILAAIRTATLAAAPLPDVGRLEAVRYPDIRDRFARSVVEVGGRCIAVEGSLEEALATVPEYLAAKKVVSLVDGVSRANVDLLAVSDPHQLHDVDFCVLAAELGVAENGACWIVHHGGANRAAAFLTQHLAVVVPAASLVHNLHEAYERILIPSPGFAMWLSGPSKTADIEQALVIGAHGARSCTVLVTP